MSTAVVFVSVRVFTLLTVGYVRGIRFVARHSPDNLVTVLPGAPRVLRYRPGAPTTAASLRRRLSLLRAMGTLSDGPLPDKPVLGEGDHQTTQDNFENNL